MFWLLIAIVLNLALSGRLPLYASFLHKTDDGEATTP